MGGYILLLGLNYVEGCGTGCRVDGVNETVGVASHTPSVTGHH